jgi:hypothetical protein
MRVDILSYAPHHATAGSAMLAGLKRHGVRASMGQWSGAPVAVCWGWRRASALRGKAQVLVMERGYVGDRVHWISLAWNGLNGRGQVPPVTDGGERWRKHFAHYLAPWKEGGEAVVVMGQVPGDQSIVGVKIGDWYRQACEAGKRFGEVVFRPHPVALERGMRDAPPNCARVLKGSLSDALALSKCVVTYNSNAGVDSVLAGVPTIACDEGSMAWPVAGHGLDADPPKPDREAWCASLAWRQWTKAEIEAGEAWEYLKQELH